LMPSVPSAVEGVNLDSYIGSLRTCQHLHNIRINF
jgi:hypothetical protein